MSNFPHSTSDNVGVSSDGVVLCERSDTDEIASLREEVSSLTAQMADLQRDVQGSREREAELLGFTEKLSSKNAQLQSESNALQSQLDQLSSNFTEVQARLEETSRLLDDKVGSLCTDRGLCLSKDVGYPMIPPSSFSCSHDS